MVVGARDGRSPSRTRSGPLRRRAGSTAGGGRRIDILVGPISVFTCSDPNVHFTALLAFTCRDPGAHAREIRTFTNQDAFYAWWHAHRSTGFTQFRRYTERPPGPAVHPCRSGSRINRDSPPPRAGSARQTLRATNRTSLTGFGGPQSACPSTISSRTMAKPSLNIAAS